MEPRTTFADPSALTSTDRVEQLLDELGRCKRSAARRALEQELVTLTLDMADSAARRYRGRGIDQDDLTQVARLALVKAIRGYNSDKGNAFAAYAVPTVLGELKRHFRDHGWAVRPPRRLQEARAAIATTHERLRHELMREPTEAEIAAAVGATPSLLDSARTATRVYRTTSLESGGADGLPLQVPDERDEMEAVVTRHALHSALLQLTDREQRILHLRFVEERTQAEIGAEIGVSQMQVSRLLTGILERLRHTLVDTEEAA
ncbi:sigma-70 family RNA polymerase sigma factor [Knoellia koreensis]|jgi:RNA polymerase sigma-B factor|uniref:Sigma-70 family RNA polymerase sigma factor n=1 Tax=Knoellia koreensis TaxID=2730921 RepID=A0A849HKD1_9MICO|nr:sigma-70 family RNA polymerase sigma factor [Knoellia sp. DB2414S]NNM45107.1 sigma-70 family RNA polymerase sigma factor [Knoellia sp. DB2414S]